MILSRPQFDALRVTLKTTAADMVARYRELGCTVSSMASGPNAAADGRPARSYLVVLLPAQRPGTAPKTLGDCFPKLKLPSQRRK